MADRQPGFGDFVDHAAARRVEPVTGLAPVSLVTTPFARLLVIREVGATREAQVAILLDAGPGLPAPGRTLTGLSRGVQAVVAGRMTAGTLKALGEEKLAAHAPLRRLGGDEDLKGITVLFASDAGRHITGQWMAVDGGVSVVTGG